MSETDENSSVFDTSIPITHSPSPIHCDGHGRPVPHIEKQMDNEVEQVFREWDENVKCRKESTFHVRPMSQSSSGKHRGLANSLTQPAHESPKQTTKFEFPEIDIIKREDTNFSTSTESLDENKRNFFTESPITGERMFNIEFDVKGYDQQNISVKVSGSRLIVHAVQQETDSGRKSTTEFCRKVKLPSGVDVHKLQCNCVNEKLIVQAPLQHKHSFSGTGTPTFSVSSPQIEPLNKPLFRNSPLGKSLSLTVDLGRVFRADDVVVKVKSQNKMIVHAQREEVNEKSKMAATMTREFDLEEKIVPQSIKAGLTADGLLKITAQVLVDVRVITNGLDDETG